MIQDNEVKAKQPIRDEIAKQTEEFLKNGGKIDFKPMWHEELSKANYRQKFHNPASY